MFVVDCTLWLRKANTAADNGVLYDWISESDCMAACLVLPSCVAIDVGPVACVIHNNVSDLAAAYNASEVTQFVLNRHCLRAAPRTTATSVNFTAASSATRTSTGSRKCCQTLLIKEY